MKETVRGEKEREREAISSGLVSFPFKVCVFRISGNGDRVQETERGEDGAGTLGNGYPAIVIECKSQ